MSSRRNTELFLLIAAAFPVTLLYAMYVVFTGTALTFGTLAVPIGLFVAFAAAHIAVRLLAPGADPAILPVVFALSGIGITFVTRFTISSCTWIKSHCSISGSLILYAISAASFSSY